MSELRDYITHITGIDGVKSVEVFGEKTDLRYTIVTYEGNLKGLSEEDLKVLSYIIEKAEDAAWSEGYHDS